MDQFSGAYPGGPTRREPLGQAESKEALPAIRCGEDNEWRAGLRGQEGRLKSRRVRAVLGVGTTLLISAAAGIYWGFSAARASDELAENARVMVDRPDVDVSREMDRLIDELWKMDELDRAPRSLRP